MTAAASSILAWDVGGAAVKAADGRGWTHAVGFPLWQAAADLPALLTRIAATRRPERIVATMTGEIADCFVDRSDGVTRIVDAVVQSAHAVGCPAPPGIYLVDGTIVPPEVACRRPLEAAASNWHAVARLAAAVAASDRGLLVDVGSTTTDIVACDRRGPTPLARDDAGRMLHDELVYTGVERTPLAAIVRRLPHGGLRRPLAAERFAESRDAWILLGELPEDPQARDTADGRPGTAAAAAARIARALLLDPHELSPAEARRAAAAVAAAQTRRLARGLLTVAAAHGWRPEVVVLSGHGTALAHRALDRVGWPVRRLSLADALGAAVSRSAPAHALARIATGDLP